MNLDPTYLIVSAILTFFIARWIATLLMGRGSSSQKWGMTIILWIVFIVLAQIPAQ